MSEEIKNNQISKEIKDICRSCEENIHCQNKVCAFRSLGNEYCDYILNATRLYLDLQQKVEQLEKEIDRLRKNVFDDLQIIEEKDKEIERLNNIIDTILDFNFFKEECALNFGFSDKKEEKAQDVFYEDDYCEKNCNDIYKKCWLKYFEKLKELKEEK